jgi:hypothetical protein
MGMKGRRGAARFTAEDAEETQRSAEEYCSRGRRAELFFHRAPPRSLCALCRKLPGFYPLISLSSPDPPSFGFGVLLLTLGEGKARLDRS